MEKKGLGIKDVLLLISVLISLGTLVMWGISFGEFKQKTELKLEQKDRDSEVIKEHTIIITQLATLMEVVQKQNDLMREELKNKQDKKR